MRNVKNLINSGGYSKGQVTLINMIGIILTLIVYATLAVPILNPMIADTETNLLAHPNEFTYMIIALLHLVQFFLLLMIIITGLNYAIPQREGQRY